MGNIKVGLALGSGGLRGLAHIGVIKVLESEKIPINMIAGCSIGSIIGAFYASGMDIKLLERLALHMNRQHIIDFVLPKAGLLAGTKITNMLKILTKQNTFSQLNIPLAVVATNLADGKETIFTEGNVADAVRASISVPGVFVPAQIGDQHYIDGAVINPTPADVVRKMGADIVIAVDLLCREMCTVRTSNILDILVQAIDIMQIELLRHRLEHGDITIRPQVSHFSPSDFRHAKELIKIGEQAALQVIPRIRDVISALNYTKQTGD